jgi:flagellin
LDNSQEMLKKSIERLSSGSRITQPSDDPAGLAVSDKLDAQNQRLSAATTNVQNATSYLQTADGFLSTTGDILTRMSELTTMAKDVTKNSSDIAAYQTEFSSLQQQLQQTFTGSGGSTPLGTFNGTQLFGPNPSGTTVSIGADAGQTLTIPETNMQTGSMATLLTQTTPPAFDVSVSDPNASNDVINALQQVASSRATIGASESRLNQVSATLQTESQNLTSAISRISDVDVAQESTEFAKNNILVQAATSMLAQANQLPQAVLKLLQQ